jgi:hypothetical protein
MSLNGRVSYARAPSTSGIRRLREIEPTIVKRRRRERVEHSEVYEVAIAVNMSP